MRLPKIKHLLFPHAHNNHKAKILHHSGLVWITIIALSLPFWLKFSSFSHQPQVLGYISNITPRQIVDLTNQQRINQGLEPLNLDSQLTNAAYQKAQDMLAKDYWAHVSPTGEQPWAFINRAGYEYLYAGENLARDFSDAPSTINAWMASPTHKDNIINPHYADIGVAVVEGELKGIKTTLIVQEFGSRRVLSQLPSVNTLAAKAKPAQVTQEQNEQIKTPLQVEETPPLINQIPSSKISPVSPLEVTKSWTLAISILMGFVLMADALIIAHTKVPRIAGRPVAHVLFITMIIGAIIATRPGFIK